MIATQYRFSFTSNSRLWRGILAALLLPGSLIAKDGNWFRKLFSPSSQKQMALALEKSRSLAIGSFEGSTSTTARQSLEAQFARHSELGLVDEKTARFLISGTSVSGRITARLSERSGTVLFERTYGAPELDDNVAALADDVVMAVTGLPGAAGSRIVFVSNVGGTKQVHVCKSDGSGVMRVTSSPNGAVSPAISPDGSLLAYTSYQTGFPVVMMVDLGGGMERQLASTPGANSGVAFAPEDRRAALTMSFLGNPEIFVVDLGTHNAICITESTGAPASPTWHPGGELLMFASDENGSGSQLYVVDVGSESAANHWPAGYRFVTDPEWSPDGKQIAYTAKLAGDWAVVIKPYEGGRARVLRRGGAQHPTWSPDGKSIAYVQSGQLWVHDLETDVRRSIVRGMGEISEPRWMR